ncbi:MAG: hypothetical protein ACYC6I_12260 [Bacillota bacterium]
MSPRPPLTERQQRMVDRYKLFTGSVALVLGLIMVHRMATTGSTFTGWLLGLAFVGFGVVRVRTLIMLLTGRAAGR